MTLKTNPNILIVSILVILQTFQSCKSIEALYPGYTPIPIDSLDKMREALNFYSEWNSVELDKEKTGIVIQKIELMLNDSSLSRIYRTSELPDTLFKVMRKIQNDYIRKIYSDYPEELLKTMVKHIVIYKEDLGNANEPFNATCIVRDELPYRQLNFAIKDGDSYLISYNHGRGILGPHRHLAYVDISGSNMTITFQQDSRYYSEKLLPLSFGQIDYFQGEIYDGDEEDIF